MKRTRRKTLSVAEVLDLPPLFPVWPTLGQILDTGKTATYEMARAGTLPVPVVKVGRQLRVRRVDTLALLGLTEASSNGDAGESCQAAPDAAARVTPSNQR